MLYKFQKGIVKLFSVALIYILDYIMASKGLSQRYSFTVTLKPVLFRVPAESQYDKTTESLCDMLRDVSHTYTLVAELTKNMNIHYHGVIIFHMGPKNLIKKFVDAFRAHAKFGFVCIKVITDEPGWIDYISKELKNTYESIGRRPIVYDGVGLFPIGLFEAYGISE